MELSRDSVVSHNTAEVLFCSYKPVLLRRMVLLDIPEQEWDMFYVKLGSTGTITSLNNYMKSA